MFCLDIWCWHILSQLLDRLSTAKANKRGSNCTTNKLVCTRIATTVQTEWQLAKTYLDSGHLFSKCYWWKSIQFTNSNSLFYYYKHNWSIYGSTTLTQIVLRNEFCKSILFYNFFNSLINFLYLFSVSIWYSNLLSQHINEYVYCFKKCSSYN